MKQFLILCFAWCISTYAIASNTITLSSVSGTPQTEVEVVVSLDNTDAIVALEMVLPLGEHLSYSNNSATLAAARSNGHQISAAQVGQELRIYVYSLSQNALNGNTGELLTFRLLLGNEPANYTLSPTVVLSNAQGTSIAGSTQTGTVAIQAPKLQVLNSQIDYGHIPIRATYTKNLQLKNVGNLPLTIENITTTDPLFVPKQTTLIIEAGQTTSITIEYTPTERGATSAELVVKSNSINGDQVATIVADPFSVNELHVGTASGIADGIVTISLTMNNMEPIVAMQCAFKLPKQLEYVANSLAVNTTRANGHQALSTLRGDTLFLAIFSMTNQPLRANDGEVATFQLRLNGSSGTYYLKPIDVVLSNITEENMVSATSQGKVTIKAPSISSNASLSFGNIPITEVAHATYSVRNNGSAPLVLERATFLAEGYSIVEELPITIANYKTSAITVAYQPTEEGDFSTTMNLYTNDPNNRLKTVALSGHVFEPNTLTLDGQNNQDDTYTLSVALDNYTDIVAVQYDLHWRNDMTTSQSAFVPSARMQNHNAVVTPLDEDSYRVIIYSMSNAPIIGNEGELHQLVFTPQGNVNYCGSTIYVDNIVLSNAAGGDKTSARSITLRAERPQWASDTATACDEYYWNGKTYTQSGTYIDTIPSIAGCDSIVTLHLTINQTQYAEKTVTACDSYTWNGETYTTSGDYVYMTTATNGCDSIVTLHLTINNTQYAEESVVACDSYTWNGETYTESGEYVYSTVAANGCDSIVTLHLTINRSEHEEYNVTACDQYEWHGETYTESGDYEYRTTITHIVKKLYVGYNAQNDPIVGLVPPRGISRFTVDGYITSGSGACFVGTGSPENGKVSDGGDLRIFDAGCLYYDRMAGRKYCFFNDFREPFNIEFGNYYAKNIETGEYYFNAGENVYEYSNTEYPITLFYKDYGKIHKVQFFDNNNLLWADINAVIEGGVPMIRIDYYEADGTIYHTQKFTENLYADPKNDINISYDCERVDILHLTINRSEHEEYNVTACYQYEWHGNTYTQSGDYEYRNTTEHGCERVEVLHLTINQSEVGDTEYATICYGETYTWNGQTYAVAGEYSVTLTNAAGCDSIATLHLTIMPEAVTTTETVVISSDELPYTWRDNTYLATGSYTDVEQYTQVDCDSAIHVLDLTVLTTGTLDEQSVTICETEAPYVWYGESYTATGKYTYTEKYAGTDIDSVQHILNLTVNPTQYTEETITACDSYTWNGETYTESGEYTYNTTAANGCDSIVTLHLTINHTQYAEEIVVACDSYTWNGETYTASGEYTYTTTAVNSCDSIVILHLTINQTQYAEEAVVACDNYTWNGETYTESGEYVYTTTAANSCDSIVTLHLTILPEATTESEELALCPSELPYEWYGQTLTEAGSYTATEQYVGMECDSVIHELTVNVYVHTQPATVTQPIVRTGEAIDVTIPTAEIQAHIAAETWYAPNAEVAWYIMDNSDWTALTTEPVAAGTKQVTLKYAVETDCGNVESENMVIAIEPTGVENTQSPSPTSNCQKILHEDHIYILRESKIYTIMGQEL